MSEPRRSHRLARQLQAELAALINDEIDDPRVGHLSVTGVKLSRDLRHARIFVHSIEEARDHKQLLRGLESAKGFLRTQLSHRLGHLRRTPELTFAYDTTFDAEVRIEELLGLFESEE